MNLWEMLKFPKDEDDPRFRGEDIRSFVYFFFPLQDKGLGEWMTMNDPESRKKAQMLRAWLKSVLKRMSNSGFKLKWTTLLDTMANGKYLSFYVAKAHPKSLPMLANRGENMLFMGLKTTLIIIHKGHPYVHIGFCGNPKKENSLYSIFLKLFDGVGDRVVVYKHTTGKDIGDISRDVSDIRFYDHKKCLKEYTSFEAFIKDIVRG